MVWKRLRHYPCTFPFLLILSLITAAVNSQKLTDRSACDLVTFIPFTDTRPGPPEVHADAAYAYGYGTWPSAESLAKASYSLLAAAEMARHHFNTRNTVLVPELSNLTAGCPITLGNTYLDSAYDRRHSIDALLDHGPPVCAVIGPASDHVAQGLSAVTEAWQVPQISYATNGYRLSKRSEYPMVARVLPVAYDFGEAVTMLFQRDIWKREAAGIIYEETDYGEQFESPIEDYEEDLGYVTITESFTAGDDDSIRSSMMDAKENGFRTIVLITDQVAMLDDVARIAEELQMLGAGYLYIISGGALPPTLLAESVMHPVDSPMDKMLRGAAVFTDYDPFVYYGETDPFLSEWKKQDRQFVIRSNMLQPTKNDSSPFFTGSEGYFQAESPTEYASYMYDAIMTAGISACTAWSARHGSGEASHMSHVLQTEFTGAAGPFRFKDGEDSNGNPEKENFRDPQDTVFGVYNIRPAAVEESGLQRYEPVLTYLYEKKDGDGSIWKPVNGTEFLFFDGTSDEPMPRRVPSNSHFISRPIFVIGITLSSIATFLSLISGVWVVLARKTKLVQASQPEFLVMICCGASMVSISVIFASFDEDKMVSLATLDAFCSTLPWLFVLGYLIMFSALFSKLWRISQLLQMRRRQTIGVVQVLLPFAVLAVFCVVVLLVWQLVDPLQWHREPIRLEPYETYGSCTGEKYGYMPFLTPLAVLLFVAVFATAAFSWKMRSVQSELAESKWIFAGIYVHIQTWLVGVPLLYITHGVSRDAFYLMMVTLTFTFSTSLVGLVIWPKAFETLRQKLGIQDTSTKTRISVMQGKSHITGLSASADTTSVRKVPNPSSASTSSFRHKDGN